MAVLIEGPVRIPEHGIPPKTIDELVGRVSSRSADLSIAMMRSPEGWNEPGQTPEFDEYTVVLSGTLHVETRNGEFDVGAGQAVVAQKGEWVRYSSPLPGGAEYLSVCVPAFSPDGAHRDEL